MRHSLDHRLLKLEDYRARRRLPDDPRHWRADDFAVYFANLSPDELAAIDAQADAELAEWERELEHLEDYGGMTDD